MTLNPFTCHQDATEAAFKGALSSALAQRKRQGQDFADIALACDLSAKRLSALATEVGKMPSLAVYLRLARELGPRFIEQCHAPVATLSVRRNDQADPGVRGIMADLTSLSAQLAEATRDAKLTPQEDLAARQNALSVADYLTGFARHSHAGRI